jgi:hypothetical protein
MSMIRAEYIWIDGNKPTQKLRSKTKVIEKGSEPPATHPTVCCGRSRSFPIPFAAGTTSW